MGKRKKSTTITVPKSTPDVHGETQEHNKDAAGPLTTPQFTADLDEMRATAPEEDPLTAMRTELTVWIDSLSNNSVLSDPVFDGMVREFNRMDKSLSSVLTGVEKFLKGVNSICEGMAAVSDSLVIDLAKTTDNSIASDCCKFREATSNVSRADAPHSVVAKLKRDLHFNITGPLKAHILHNRKIRYQLDTRRRRLQEFIIARKAFLAIKQNASVELHDPKYTQFEQAAEAARIAFEEIDRPLLEWLLMLQEYKGDISDSLVQTLKYLQYEFFAGSAHCISHVLPTRMEFRPLVEMTPDQLEPLVEMELNECLKNEQNEKNVTALDYSLHGTTSKLLQHWRLDNCESESQLLDVDNNQSSDKSTYQVSTHSTISDVATSVDLLSLSVLISQGFEEGAARRALREHNNDSQAALECLLQQHDHSTVSPLLGAKGNQQNRQQVIDSVRVPSTLKWVRKLREHRLKTAVPTTTDENNRNDIAEEDQNKTATSPTSSSSSSSSVSSLLSESLSESSQDKKPQKKHNTKFYRHRNSRKSERTFKKKKGSLLSSSSSERRQSTTKTKNHNKSVTMDSDYNSRTVSSSSKTETTSEDSLSSHEEQKIHKKRKKKLIKRQYKKVDETKTNGVGRDSEKKELSSESDSYKAVFKKKAIRPKTISHKNHQSSSNKHGTPEARGKLHGSLDLLLDFSPVSENKYHHGMQQRNSDLKICQDNPKESRKHISPASSAITKLTILESNIESSSSSDGTSSDNEETLNKNKEQKHNHFRTTQNNFRKSRSVEKVANLGDLLDLNENIDTANTLNEHIPPTDLYPSLPQTIKPFNPSLCKLSKAYHVNDGLISNEHIVTSKLTDTTTTDGRLNHNDNGDMIQTS